MAEEWLSYKELGERLGVSPEAARQQAIRRRLPRRLANDGKAQVLCDLDELRATHTPRTPKDDEGPDDDRPTAEEQAIDARMLEALEAQISTLRELVARADEATVRERERADDERRRADVERATADVERTRADELRTRLETLLGEKARAEAATAEAERLRAEIAGLRRPWWRRLAG